MVLRGKPVGEQGAADRWTALAFFHIARGRGASAPLFHRLFQGGSGPPFSPGGRRAPPPAAPGLAIPCRPRPAPPRRRGADTIGTLVAMYREVPWLKQESASILSKSLAWSAFSTTRLDSFPACSPKKSAVTAMHPLVLLLITLVALRHAKQFLNRSASGSGKREWVVRTSVSLAMPTAGQSPFSPVGLLRSRKGWESRKSPFLFRSRGILQSQMPWRSLLKTGPSQRLSARPKGLKLRNRFARHVRFLTSLSVFSRRRFSRRWVRLRLSKRVISHEARFER